jgi:hypothetical protein
MRSITLQSHVPGQLVTLMLSLMRGVLDNLVMRVAVRNCQAGG